MQPKRVYTGFAGLIVFLSLTVPQAVRAQESTVTLENQSGQPALAKIVGPTEHIVAVTSGHQKSVHVAPGIYRLLVRYGNEGDEYRFAEGEPFSVAESQNQYSVVSITLHKVEGGNYPVRLISEAEFDMACIQKKPPSPDRAKIDQGGLLTLTIKGRIRNSHEVQSFITDESHLQLVFYPDSQNVGLILDPGKGVMRARSDLAISTIAQDGSFSFPEARLMPGHYIIAAQGFKGLGLGGSSLFLMQNSNGRLVVIDITREKKSPGIVDLGDVFVRLTTTSQSIELREEPRTRVGSGSPKDLQPEVHVAERHKRAFTITGEITNWDEAREFLKQDSYLQLVRITSDQFSAFDGPGSGRMELKIRMDDQARFTFVSELAKSSLPSDGHFSFENAELDPGRYLIVIQKHRPPMLGFPRTASQFIARKVGEKFAYVIVEIGEGPHEQLVRDLGKLIIQVTRLVRR